jgi:hypothetical protein
MSENKVAIVTGASSGIGAATARIFAQEGFRVVLAARRIDRLEELVNGIREGGGEALAVQTDVGNYVEIEDLVAAALKQYGQIDVLFNNAGFGRFKWLEEMDPQRDITSQFDVNVLGVILTTRAVLPHMIERRTGHIINMASLAAYVGTPTYTIYAASKHAVRGFTESLRREVGVWGIEVSAIFPGGVATEFGAHTEAKRKTGITTPKWLLLSAEDVGRAVVKTAKGGSRMWVLPGVSRFGVWFNALLPRLNDWIIERTFTKPERGL